MDNTNQQQRNNRTNLSLYTAIDKSNAPFAMASFVGRVINPRELREVTRAGGDVTPVKGFLIPVTGVDPNLIARFVNNGLVPTPSAKDPNTIWLDATAWGTVAKRIDTMVAQHGSGQQYHFVGKLDIKVDTYNGNNTNKVVFTVFEVSPVGFTTQAAPQQNAGYQAPQGAYQPPQGGYQAPAPQGGYQAPAPQGGYQAPAQQGWGTPPPAAPAAPAPAPAPAPQQAPAQQGWNNQPAPQQAPGFFDIGDDDGELPF